MQLYAGSSTDFITDSVQNVIAQKLGDSFYEYYRYRTSVSEMTSWQNSLRALTSQLQYTRLDDHGIILEMQLPLSSARLDCMITGRSPAGEARAVIVELKQWSHVAQADPDDCVITFVGKAEREVAHPSRQAGNYSLYLGQMNSAFHAGPEAVRLDACSYLHNMQPTDAAALLEPRFERLLADYPMFIAGDADRLGGFLKTRLAAGQGMPLLDRVLNGRFAPSKGLMSHVTSMIRGTPVYTLLDEQIVAYNTIVDAVRKAKKGRGRTVVIIRGGPGTGKSVLALNAMATLLSEHFTVFHATGSRAFTENLRKILGRDASPLFRYFNQFVSAGKGEIDVLICDEAHRIRESSNQRYTPKDKRSDRAQLEELIEAACVSVFFVDDNQAVRPGEMGSSVAFRSIAKSLGARVREQELRTQFRCAGSEAFIDWVDQLLEIRKTGTVDFPDDDRFDFQILDSPLDVEAAVREQAQSGASARMTAGFCWRWSDPDENGRLHDDVVIGDYRRPWNAKPDARRLARGIPKSNFWATDPAGIDQIGCVYTAQGFEFDYVGVIVGRDLRYDWDEKKWVGSPSASRDSVVARAGPPFTDFVKNTYRVLLTRGMKGCFVYFMDKGTERFVRSRMPPA
jgi:DUF2075 family protein